ncbi:MAG: translation initiation factor IF-3 [Anaerolineae bacterium]|nr:translation initiation factor IF-3 [Anaerolineae bacterium]
MFSKAAKSKERQAINNPEYRINRQIRAREVRLIDQNNENVGVVPFLRALEMAETADLDLVEVAPTAVPPVCRIMDFGKFQYEKQRRERKAKKAQKIVEVKQVRLNPGTDDYHLGFKMEDARKWLQEGNKVRFSIRFRGRQNLHTEIGLNRLIRIAEEMKDVSQIEQNATLEGNTMTMTLAPLG